LVFSFIAYIYIDRVAEHDNKYFATHAAILADNIWALNQNGADAYLQLAVKANHYKSLAVSIPGDSSYISVASAPLTGLSSLLYRMKLIGVKELSKEITYDGQIIGLLTGEKYVRVIFPLVNILIFLLLITLTVIFIIHLFRNRKFLEQEILERTRNLLESERRFHDLVDLLPEMVVETDLTGNITYANKVANSHLQPSTEQNMASNFFQLIAEDQREEAKRNFQDSLQGSRSELIEFTARDNKHDTTFPILIRSAPIKKNGTVCGARMIVIDITEQRLLEKQLNRDQKMKAIGLMAGGVAHDLNNILSGIISYPELLLLDLDQESSLRRPLEAIRRSGIDASEVVSDLLTVARGVAANKEVIAPNEFIENYLKSADFLQLQARYPLIDFTTSLDPQLRNISCSPIHIRKCLMNLITNGAEAIHGEGTISIVSSNEQHSLPLIKNKQHITTGTFSKIAIHDDGSGIAAGDLDHIFEPFYTKKVMGRSGTGLGLAVVWNTMRDHGGMVNVISNTQGTTFELYFPSVETATAPRPLSRDWRSYKGRGQTILVVDDEPGQREIAAQLLTSLEYAVHTVPSGEEAIQYARKHTTDLMVLDMIMAPGQNGRKTFEQILKIHPQQKAIIASGFAEDDDVQATLAMGAMAFVPKPYTLDQIGSTIHNIFQQ
jgi:PAS domain S-box-containing protein